ncbi:hypothetical protein LOAG_10834 [Loa loa]|uniref:Uncharacterized protein n=1 Tax=Loa loa TaxID=7209 RepID=A0A1S0TP52_LOALO|nr:hypothetical protein LOAG_10834 [Loa loa]EFO17663.1 hypothetical protein LOAG_10834 [Loa loa]
MIVYDRIYFEIHFPIELDALRYFVNLIAVEMSSLQLPPVYDGYRWHPWKEWLWNFRNLCKRRQTLLGTTQKFILEILFKIVRLYMISSPIFRMLFARTKNTLFTFCNRDPKPKELSTPLLIASVLTVIGNENQKVKEISKNFRIHGYIDEVQKIWEMR